MLEDEDNAEFDALALFAALDAQREERGLSWSGVAREIWELSAELNARRRDHPISPPTLTGMAKRGDISCQHALFMPRWLGRSPESFLRGGDDRRRRPAYCSFCHLHDVGDADHPVAAAPRRGLRLRRRLVKVGRSHDSDQQPRRSPGPSANLGGSTSSSTARESCTRACRRRTARGMGPDDRDQRGRCRQRDPARVAPSDRR
jgi:hypothetical protein